MEILMKLKCTPAVPGSKPSLSTVKIIDHHQQIKQQSIGLTKISQQHPPARAPHSVSTTIKQEIIQPPTECMNYAIPTAMDCCAGIPKAHSLIPSPTSLPPPPAIASSAPSECTKLCYDSTTGYCVGGNESACTVLPPPSQPSSCCNNLSMAISNTQSLSLAPSYNNSHYEQNHYDNVQHDMLHDDNYEYEEPEENFVSIDDAKIKGFLMNIGNQNQQQHNFDIGKYHVESKKVKLEKQTDEILSAKLPRNENLNTKIKSDPVIFEIIELDDEQEQQRLQNFKNQAIDKAKEQQQRQPQIASSIQSKQQLQQNLQRLHVHKSADISLILKPSDYAINEVKPSQHAASSEQRIVAKIELLDSSDEDENFDDEEFPLAAASVSCELECDDDEDDDGDGDGDADADGDNEVDADDAGNHSTSTPTKKPRHGNDSMFLLSDDENMADYIIENEEGVELRWEDITERNRSREKETTHECQVCGKVVQSSYNLRRHMMIHTGERPFGCDLCVRRFREFSDLKKHRRRHVNEENYICMVCRQSKPTPNDPTRCFGCEYKQIPPKFFSDQARVEAAVVTASMDDAAGTLTQPPKLLKKPPSRNSTPAPVAAQQRTTTTPTATITTAVVAKSSATAKVASSTPPPLKKATTPPLPPLTPISNSTTLSQDTDAWLNQLTAMQRVQNNNNVSGQQGAGNSSSGVGGRKEFACPLCERAFGTRHNLKRHFMIHTGEKPFSCTECRKPFREYSTLKKHMVTHLRERWYRCADCPECFLDYIEYMEHKKVHEFEEESSDAQPALHSTTTTTSMSSVTNSSNNSLTNSPQKRDYPRAIASGIYSTSTTSIAPFEICDSNDDSCAEDWLECCECHQRFTDIDVYTEHLKEHNPRLHVFECYICKDHFETLDMLEEHITICKDRHSKDQVTQPKFELLVNDENDNVNDHDDDDDDDEEL